MRNGYLAEPLDGDILRSTSDPLVEVPPPFIGIRSLMPFCLFRSSRNLLNPRAIEGVNPREGLISGPRFLILIHRNLVHFYNQFLLFRRLSTVPHLFSLFVHFSRGLTPVWNRSDPFRWTTRLP